jgi:WD40 repeat protein
LTDLITREPLQTFKHAKFVIRSAFSQCGRWLATASYDRTIAIYEAVDRLSQSSHNGFKHWSAVDDDDAMIIDEEDDPDLAKEPSLRYVERFRVTVKTNPEAIEFHPLSTYLLYTLRGSHLLHYISLPLEQVSDNDKSPFNISHKNFNPHPLDTHVSFSVLNMAIHPSGKVIACQTGDHAGGGGERILLYGIEPDETGAERLACLWTGEEGDDFVLPRMAWLPDGTGLV